MLPKIDYIESLGVNVIWFNPMFVSGWIDGGYDVKDYYKVDPRFGTNSDMVKLIDECHRRGIKVFLDLVPGHTSMDHPWFRQSMEADANQQYSDYYIWSDRLPDEKAEKELEKMIKQGDIWQNTTGKWMDASYLNSAGRSNTVRKMYFDHKHQADGGSYFSLDGCQPSLKDLYGNPWPEDRIDAGISAADALKKYYDFYGDAIEWTKDMGYFASITGNHDHLRFNTGARNNPQQLKVAVAWILTQQLPILYYGDEIGILQTPSWQMIQFAEAFIL